ncbi:unnamed protein product [Gemmata massiliana]|uniref:Uncharacterized protein n=1 Tax=Gemmata massiliana TaxID=1210884 RepID=A0A6P2CSQ0_9BACT|nr:unnamed protein product [Gemmata massiliana]
MSNSDLIQPGDYLIWYRKNRSQPWKLVNRAGSWPIAVRLIGVGYSNGEWFVGEQGRWFPKGDDYDTPKVESLPPRVTSLRPDPKAVEIQEQLAVAM